MGSALFSNYRSPSEAIAHHRFEMHDSRDETLVSHRCDYFGWPQRHSHCPSVIPILDGPSVHGPGEGAWHQRLLPWHQRLLRTNVFSAPTSSPHQRLLLAPTSSSTSSGRCLLNCSPFYLLNTLDGPSVLWPQRPLAPASFGPSVKLSFQRPCL